MPFSVEHLICRYVQTDRQTDRQTDELIRVGLGNQRFLQVNRQFPVILSFMYYISKNSDSRFTWIHDFEENLTESVGPMPFSAEHLICRYVQTDRQTDRQTNRVSRKPNLLCLLLICRVFFVAGKHNRFKSVDMSTFEQI